jgi:hypothetical protein
MNDELRSTVMMLVFAAAVGGAGCDGPSGPLGDGPNGAAASAGSGGLTDATAGGTASCNCATVARAQGSPIVHQALSCLCDGSAGALPTCGVTLSTYVPTCASPELIAGTIRRTGCGKVTYEATVGLGSWAQTFDAVSGALLGLSEDGDALFGMCSANSYVYGDLNDDCAGVQTCFLCGTWNFEKAPPCQ